MNDQKYTVNSMELFLLRRISSTGSDVFKGFADEEFRKSCGGQEYLINRHYSAIRAHKQWSKDSDK